MPRVLSAAATALALLVPAPTASAAADALTAAGDQLRGLPDGAQIALTGPDGARIVLERRREELRLVAPKATLEAGALRTPGGYRIFLVDVPQGRRIDFVVEAPAGGKTHFYFTPSQIWALENDAGVWVLPHEVLIAWLSDGTRIDFDRPENVIQVSVGGASWRNAGTELVATTEPPTTAQAVNPTTVYQSGDGDDWSQLVDSKATMEIWTGGGPLTFEALLAWPQDPRREWIKTGLGRVDAGDPRQAGAYLLAACFALPAGSFVAFGAGAKDAEEIPILPGVLEIPTLQVMTYSGPMKAGG